MSGGQEPQRTRISSRAIPSWLLVASVAVVVVAVVGFFVSGQPDGETKVADASATTTPTATSPTTSPTPQESRQPAKDKKDEKGAKKKNKGEKKDATKQVPRAFVEIFNNTGVKGLASSTSSQVQGAGWTVVGTDNWYGNIPATTIYYPERLEKQAEVLADDLGIDRVRPAVDPMKFDRLTLILTGQV